MRPSSQTTPQADLNEQADPLAHWRTKLEQLTALEPLGPIRLEFSCSPRDTPKAGVWNFVYFIKGHTQALARYIPPGYDDSGFTWAFLGPETLLYALHTIADHHGWAYLEGEIGALQLLTPGGVALEAHLLSPEREALEDRLPWPRLELLVRALEVLV